MQSYNTIRYGLVDVFDEHSVYIISTVSAKQRVSPSICRPPRQPQPNDTIAFIRFFENNMELNRSEFLSRLEKFVTAATATETAPVRPPTHLSLLTSLRRVAPP